MVIILRAILLMLLLRQKSVSASCSDNMVLKLWLISPVPEGERQVQGSFFEVIVPITLTGAESDGELRRLFISHFTDLCESHRDKMRHRDWGVRECLQSMESQAIDFVHAHCTTKQAGDVDMNELRNGGTPKEERSLSPPLMTQSSKFIPESKQSDDVIEEEVQWYAPAGTSVECAHGLGCRIKGRL